MGICVLFRSCLENLEIPFYFLARIQAAKEPGACEEGAEIGHSQRYTAFCAAGYVPSVSSLECYETWKNWKKMQCDADTYFMDKQLDNRKLGFQKTLHLSL